MISYGLRIPYKKFEKLVWELICLKWPQSFVKYHMVVNDMDIRDKSGGLQNEVQTSLSHFCKKSLDVQSDYFRDLM